MGWRLFRLIQQLDRYRTPSSWHPGEPHWYRALWLLIGKPLLACALPGTPWRKALLCAFGARVGAGGRIKPGLQVTFPWRLTIGDHCWLGEHLWIDNLAPVTLGDRVCLSQGAYLCTGNHDFRSPGFELRLGPISIGSDAWIAARAVLAPGCVIGTGAVVGLGAVASGSVPPGAIVRGNPAVVVGERLTGQQMPHV
jgi:putative colanic acid biosynthesis acetyltransferase WcaF